MVYRRLVKLLLRSSLVFAGLSTIAQTTVSENFEAFDTSVNRVDVTTSGVAIGGENGYTLKALSDSVNYNHDYDDGTTAEISGSFVSIIDEDAFLQRYYQVKPPTKNNPDVGTINGNLTNLDEAAYGTNIIQINTPFKGYGARGDDGQGGVDDSIIPDGLLATNAGAIVDFGIDADKTLTNLYCFSRNWTNFIFSYGLLR